MAAIFKNGRHRFYLPSISDSNCLRIMIFVIKYVLSWMRNPVISVLTWECLLKQNGGQFSKMAATDFCLFFVWVAKHVRILPQVAKYNFYGYLYYFWLPSLHWMLHCAYRLANKDYVHLGLSWNDVIHSNLHAYVYTFRHHGFLP